MSSGTDASDPIERPPDRRKLIAVVYADMVGYSRLIGLDDQGTLERLRTLRKSLIDPAIEKYGGRIVNTGGDSLLIVFDSIDGAVRCAVKVQQQVPGYDADQPADRAIRFRVGINIGDVIPDGSDIHGDVVNVAARLQAECPPGGVCVSRQVRDHVQDRLNLAFEGLGEVSLKNIARPIEAFVLRLDAAIGQTAFAPTLTHSNSDRRTVRPTLSLPDKPALAVLPFSNLSGDPEQVYFVDGLVEDIITALSRLDWMFVIARNSSFTYKGRAVDVRQVGQELGVRYVLEGSVRKVSNRVRITGQLVEATAGAHLWADHFDGSLDDVFDLQDRVTEAVAGAIEPRLQRAEIERAQLKSTQDLSAYDFYLRGMAFFYQMTKESLQTAMELFSKAIAYDPNYAVALAMMAECISEQKAHGWITDYEREMGQGMQWARRAIAVGKDDSTALCMAGFAFSYLGGETDVALALLERACVLNPNMALAWCSAGVVQTHMGDPDRGIASIERAIRLSPLDPNVDVFLRGVARAHLIAGRYDDAIAWGERALREKPGLPHALRTLTAAYALAGKIAEAHRVLAMLRQFQPSFRLSNARENIPPYRRPQDTEMILNGLRIAGLPE